MNPEEKIARVPIKSLRTFQGDVDEAMSKNKMSATTVFVAEQKRKIERPEKSFSPITTQKINFRNSTFITLGALLLLIGLGAIGAVYYLKYSEKVIVQEKNKTLIAISSEKDIAIDSLRAEQLIASITANKQSFKAPPNSTLNLNITYAGTRATVDKLLPLLGPTMPSSLTRALSGDYMVGIYSFDSNEPFILFTTNDYANSYSGMLKWEKSILTDIGPMFGSGLEGTSTPIFTDLALKNKDLRVLRDNNGKTILLYSFLDKKTLLITKNENIFNAVLGKYLISQQAR